MKTLTEEQFKQKYGDSALMKLNQMDDNRFANSSTPTKKPLSNRFTEIMGLGGATDVFGSLLARQGVGNQTKEQGQEFVEKPTRKDVAGAVLQTGSVLGGLAITGGASLPGQIAAGALGGYAYDVGQDLIDGKSIGETVTPGVGTLVGAGAPVAIRGLQAGVGALKAPVSKAISATGEAVSNVIPDSTTIQGVKQTASDIAERVPRFITRQKENVAEQAIKSQAIKDAPTPAVANAIKVELPEKFLNTVTQADEPTKAAYRKVVEMAEEVPSSVGVKKNPTIVGGELAGKQYDVIEKQRKTVGDAIGAEMKRLGLDKSKVDMNEAYDQLDGILEDQGIVRLVDEKGSRLDFSRSKLTPKQRQVVKDLYQMATEAGPKLTPSEIHKKDQLFSALQRESKAEQIEDILMDLPDGNKISMFRAFRDVYANQLDTLSPEIKDLNKKYRNIMTLIEDVEDSIFKTPNFNVTKTTDPAEFAKVNLRRIFGESQSSPAYEAIADEMDTIARQLGYADAKPKDVAAFAQELRELYPEITPRTGFAGGIKAGIGDIIEKVFSAGEISPKDKQNALKALLGVANSK